MRGLLPPGFPAWASLADSLPILAEAAPGTFLECVEASLSEGETGVAHLLELETGMGGNPHTGLVGPGDARLGRAADAACRVHPREVGRG